LFTATSTQQAFLVGDLQIEYFAANPASIAPGDVLTLYWSVKGVDRVAIYRLNPDGTRGQVWNRGKSGALQVPTDDMNQTVVKFVLTVDSGNAHLEQSLSVAVAVTPIPTVCVSPTPGTPSKITGTPSIACPTVGANSGSSGSDAAEQPFQHGRMIWIRAESRIYVIFNDAKQPAWSYYADAFKDGMLSSDPSLHPPAGLIQPIRGFGLVWRTQSGVRDRLGWATLGELAYSGSLQGDATIAGGTAYIRTRDGQTIQLSDRGSSWKVVAPP
jgi:hypothetical protein